MKPFYEPSRAATLRITASDALAGASAAARGASVCEDRIHLDAASMCFAVADGLGGHEGGAAAAQLAVSAIAPAMASMPAGADAGERLRAAVAAAEVAISASARQHADLRRMGAVLVLACVVQDELLLAHVGDARGYLQRSPVLRRLTDDHSAVGEQLRAGRIDEEEARHHPERSRLLRVLGGNKRGVEAAFGHHRLRSGDVVMLCSDGVWAALPATAIAALLAARGPASALVAGVVDAVLAGDGSDDASAIVYRHRATTDSRDGGVDAPAA